MSAESPNVKVLFSPSHFAENKFLDSSDAKSAGIEGFMDGDLSVHEGAVAFDGLIHYASCNILRYRRRKPGTSLTESLTEFVACVDFGSNGTFDDDLGAFVPGPKSKQGDGDKKTGPIIGADIDCDRDIRQADDIPEDARNKAFADVIAKYLRRLEREGKS